VVACTEWAPRGRPGKPEPGSGLTRDADMAKVAGTSDRTIRDAKVAHKAGLTDAVKDGALTAKEAARVARGKPSKESKPDKPARTLDNRPADVLDATTVEELAAANHTIADLARENDELRDRLAVESMDVSEAGKTEAANTIKELRAQAKTLEAELSAVKSSRDTYMRENAELKKSVNYWRKKAEKAEGAAA